MAYKQEVIDRVKNAISGSAKNVGTLNKAAKNIGTGLVGAPACGDVMQFQIEVDESGNIVKAMFKTFGCGSAIAASHHLAEITEGMSIDDANKISNASIAKHLSLPPVKIHCSVLAEEAIKAAIADYKRKQAEAPVAQ